MESPTQPLLTYGAERRAGGAAQLGHGAPQRRQNPGQALRMWESCACGAAKGIGERRAHKVAPWDMVGRKGSEKHSLLEKGGKEERMGGEASQEERP